VGIAMVFDYRCLPFLVHRLSKRWAVHLPEPEAPSSPSPTAPPASIAGAPWPPLPTPSPLPPQTVTVPVPAAGSPAEDSLRTAASAGAIPTALLGVQVVGMEVAHLPPPRRRPPPPLGKEALGLQDFPTVCNFGDGHPVVDPFGSTMSPSIAIGHPVGMAAGPEMSPYAPTKSPRQLDKATVEAPASTIRRDRLRGPHQWPTRLARLWGLRVAFLYVASVAVFARLVHIMLTAIIAVHRNALAVILESLLCLLPYVWCALTSRPPSEMGYGIPHHIGHFCWRLPRFTFFVLVTMMLEIYSIMITAWALTATSCNSSPWRNVLLYCLGIPVVVARTYSALLAIRLQEGIAHTHRRVLPGLPKPTTVKRSRSQNLPLSFTDISILDPDGELDISGGECRQRTPTGTLGSEEAKRKDVICGMRPGANKQQLEMDSTSCFWRCICCKRKSYDDGSSPSPMASPMSSFTGASGVSKTWSGRFRQRLRIRSKSAMVLILGLSLVLGAATASIWAFHGSGDDGKQQKLPSSCVTAQNGTASCAHWETVGDNLWDSTLHDLLSGTADTMEDCCAGCDKLSNCQGWMFEHMAKSCRWIRYLEQPCMSSPGDLSCRCLAHHGMTFGFKPTTQIVWVKRAEGPNPFASP